MISEESLKSHLENHESPQIQHRISFLSKYIDKATQEKSSKPFDKSLEKLLLECLANDL